jgi:hypothetical protein
VTTPFDVLTSIVGFSSVSLRSAVFTCAVIVASSIVRLAALWPPHAVAIDAASASARIECLMSSSGHDPAVQPKCR